MTSKIKKLLLLMLPLFFTVSCSSLLYYPDKEVYFKLEHLGKKGVEVNFQSKDKTKLKGWYLPAKKEKSKGIFLHFHGNAQNMTSHILYSFWVTKEGYDLFTFDYRGYGESKGSPSPEGLHQDALAAYKYMTENFYHPGQDVILFGQSLGGAVMLRAIPEMKSRENITAVIVDSSFASYQDIAIEKMSEQWFLWLLQPLGYVLFSDEYAPEKIMDQISPIPLVIVHGTADKIVPISHGKRIFELAKEPKKFWQVPGGIHTAAFYSSESHFRKDLIKFIETLP